jgi:hypothetical protein
VALVALGAVVVGVGAPALDAGAEEVSATELESLARRARDEPAALDRLRGVDRVDGRPVDLRRALDAPSPEAAERVRVLGEGSPSSTSGIGGTSTSTAADDARAILREPRFHARKDPRPLAGVLRRLGGWLRPVGDPIRRLVMRVADNAVGLPILAGIVVALAALIGVRVARRRTMTNLVAGRLGRRPTPVDPAELERQADAAERASDLDLAFRLRFEAGLLRLHDAGRLRLRASTTTGEVLRTVPSAALGELAMTLEEIVYGGRPAQAPDLDAARAGWARVLQETRP